MNKRTEVVIDKASWSPDPVPADISSLAGPRQVNVLLALLFTALSTRPPVVRGFQLADFWAWLRYAWAFDDSANLRLRPEWETVDPHQKTVLSDELGVGFTTYLLATELGCSEFIDTMYVVRFLEPGKFSLAGSARRGPKKSPDYIARDAESNYYVLECKGTQTSRRELTAAIGRGQKQKANLTPLKQTSIRHSLVGALFLPSSKSKESSCIMLADPPRRDLGGLLAHRSPAEIDEAIIQIALAKSFALSGLAETANALAETRTEELVHLPPSSRAELGRRRTSADQGLDVVFDTADFRRRVGPDATLPSRARFLASPPDSLVSGLADGQSVRDRIRALASQHESSGWRIRSGEAFAELRTPLGFTFRMDLG